MSFVSRQAVIGAVIAATLMLGAIASPNARPEPPSLGALTIGAQLTLSDQATLAEVLKTCRDTVLDVALDAFGEIAAHLKQL